jgi:hypothetical protein
MNKSFLMINKRKLLAALMAAGMLLPAAAADAWWGGYGPGGSGCDPQWAYLEEYGFLDPYGPSPGDWQRLNRDQWRAITAPAYHGGYGNHDPVAKAVRKQCGTWGTRVPYYW